MTFSIAARCARTGMHGLAVASSSPAVAARCSHVKAGAGAIGSQNITDPRLGLAGLEHLAAGRSADETLDLLIGQGGALIAYRQLTVVDSRGRTAAYSGANTLGIHAAAHGDGAVAAGNMLKHHGVPAAMMRCYEAGVALHLGERLAHRIDGDADDGREYEGA